MDGRTIIIHGFDTLVATPAARFGPEAVRALQQARYQVVLLSRLSSAGPADHTARLEQRLRGGDVDSARSWLVSDDPTELTAAGDSGCRTILIDESGRWMDGPGQPRYVVGTAAQAARLILALDGRVRGASSEGWLVGRTVT